MASHFLYGVIRLASALGIFSVVCGCASTPVEREVFMGEGFQSSLPNAEARVLVWGNHSGAMTRTLGWLHDHQIPAVDPSWVEKELADPIFDRRNRMEQKRQVLAAAKSVGASLVLFTQVEDSQMGWKFDVMSFGHKRMKFIGVQIRGMEADTGNVVLGAKAWNSEPLAASEQLVMDLTTFALEKAFKESQSSVALEQNVSEAEMQDEHLAGLSIPSDEESARVTPVSQSTEDKPIVISHVSSQSVYAGREETIGEVATTLPRSTDHDIAEEELLPLMSAQQTELQQEMQGAQVASLSTLSDEKTPRVRPTVQSVVDQPAILPQDSTEVVESGEEENTQGDERRPIEPLIDESIIETELQSYPENSTSDSSVVLQFASGALSILYAPIKVTYAMLGGFFGGFAYVLTAGNEPVAQSVWGASLKGDYWLTAKQLQGEEAIQFKGEPSPMQTVRQVRVNDSGVE